MSLLHAVKCSTPLSCMQTAAVMTHQVQLVHLGASTAGLDIGLLACRAALRAEGD